MSDLKLIYIEIGLTRGFMRYPAPAFGMGKREQAMIIKASDAERYRQEAEKFSGGKAYIVNF